MHKRFKIIHFLDVASVELIADNGLTAMTDIFFPNEDFNKTTVFSKGGAAFLEKCVYWQLK